MNNIVEKFAALFKGRTDAFYNGQICVRKPVTMETYQLHLDGKQTLGIYPIMDDQKVYFGTIDIDNKDIELARNLAQTCRRYRIHPFVEVSKSKGYHVWMFLKESLEAKILYQVLHQMANEARLSEYEIFPKQQCLSIGQVGNAINLPYFNCRNATTRIFIDIDTGKTIDINSFFNEVRYTPRDTLVFLEEESSNTNDCALSTAKLTYLRPCIKRILDEGVNQGERDNAAFCIMLDLKRCGVNPTEIRAILLQWNKKNHPPLDAQNTWLDPKIREFEKDYTLNCKKGQYHELLQKRCDPKICVLHKKINQQLFVVTDTIVADIIYNTELMPPIQFAVYEKASGRFYIAPAIDGHQIPAEILDNPVFTDKIIGLASGLQEYGSVSNFLDEIQQFIHDYLDIEPDSEFLLAAYALFTYVFDNFSRFPYLRALGEPASGKSRFLEVMAAISYRHIGMTGATSVSALFRVLMDYKGTLTIDEADLNDSTTSNEIIRILNCGYKTGAPVWRSTPVRYKKATYFKPEVFLVHGPKIIATRHRYQDGGIESRCLTVPMTRCLDPRIPIYLPEDFYTRAQIIRNKLLLYRLRNYGQHKVREELADRSINPRIIEITLPLLSIMPNDEYREKIHTFAKIYSEKMLKDRRSTLVAEIFDAIHRLTTESTSFTVKDVTDLVNMQKSEKDQITTRKVGGLIRKQLQFQTERTGKGYIVTFDQNLLDYWKNYFQIKQGNNGNKEK